MNRVGCADGGRYVRRCWATLLALAAAAACQAPMNWQDLPKRPFTARQAVWIGVTHTQVGPAQWHPSEAVARAEQILGRVTDYGNQHIMGWGMLNPSPAPGERDWSTLDERMAWLNTVDAEPVITLCCAPDWMKGGEPGRTDWSQIEVAPLAAHYGDFARLAVDIAKRYPRVRHFVVWNELKGFYDSATNRWNYEAYTDLYNHVYIELKKYDPSLRVGGPYVPMDSWSSAVGTSHPSSIFGPWGALDQRALDVVNYWLDYAIGADFIAVDGGSATKDEGLIADPRIANEKFSVVTGWLASQTTLPIWWMEFYPDVDNEPWNSTYRANVAVDALLRFGDAGGSVAFYWQPEGVPSFPSVGLWDSTEVPGGGRAQPLVERLALVRSAWYDGYRVDGRWIDDELELVVSPEEG
jgi:hypothetical protein